MTHATGREPDREPGKEPDREPGKGLRDGVVCELAACFDVLPDRAEQLRAAVRRFTDVVRELDPETGMRTGLRDTRHVIFDGGQRLLWCTTFERNWGSYVDQAVTLIGVEPFLDWLLHTRQGRRLYWAMPGHGARNGEEIARAGTELKAILHSVQTGAAAYFNPLGPLTLPQIIAAQRLEGAFRRVLGHPAAADALSHPALRPLARQAAALGLGEAGHPGHPGRAGHASHASDPSGLP